MTKRRFFQIALLLILGISMYVLIRGFQNEQGGQDLILALKANDTNKALRALEAHADPNTRDQSGDAPSFRRSLSTLLLRLRGVKPPVALGSSALGLAVERNNTVLVEALLARGAKNISETLRLRGSESGPVVPLMVFAASKKNAAIIQALAKHGWNVSAADDAHYTALFYAGDAATDKVLVACGADVNARFWDGKTVLDYELLLWPRIEHVGVVDTLLEAGARDAKALTLAIDSGNAKALKKMFAQGWTVNIVDNQGLTPLMYALDSADWRFKAVAPLIRMGANVNFRDRQGNTPLLLAAEGGGPSEMAKETPEIVEDLLERGAQIDAQNREGRTPLMRAAANLHPALVQLLLQHGAQVNVCTRRGETALSMARRRLSRSKPPKRKRNAVASEVIRLLKVAGATEESLAR